jgi:hypothetical protein
VIDLEGSWKRGRPKADMAKNMVGREVKLLVKLGATDMGQ